MMPPRIQSIIAATLLSAILVTLNASAQSGNQPAASAPLKGSVHVPAARERATLDGAISLRSNLRTAPDGSTIISYRCEATGSALGETSGARFTISGVESGDVPVTQSLPTDVGFSCSVTLAARDVAQLFRLTLQVGVDAAGSITSVVIRTIAPL